MLTIITIGIDDTDSERGLCTTYLAAVMMDRFRNLGEIVGIPRLIRLNPCVQFKTRGNAAIAFSLKTELPEEAKEIALRTLIELSDFSGKNTNPGLVVAEDLPSELAGFYRRALNEILDISEAKEIIERHNLWSKGFKNERGLIGALAAIGAQLLDYTYELLVYRDSSRWGFSRDIDEDSVWKADESTYPRTWDTVDHFNKKIVFAPHSPDPVLFGIRGDNPNVIKSALGMIKSENWERKVLYKTNQGTDAHINKSEIYSVVNNRSYRLRGIVAQKPNVIEGGHLFFTLYSQDRKSSIKCAAFEPTKNFRDVIRNLIPGDLIEIYGAIKKGTLNLEKIEIIQLAEKTELATPSCPSCGKKMKSAGKNQGYRCKRCGTKAEEKVRVIIQRDLETGFYEVPPCARRHLSKPLVRMKDKKVHPSR
ncbi:MAG: TiaS agmantine-binding domain-containing protein [Methanotrichaceae archaeon]